jgi:hypothetical protein
MWPVSVAGLQLANASGTSTVHTAFSGGMALQEVERTRVVAQAAERQLENPRPRRRVARYPSPFSPISPHLLGSRASQLLLPRLHDSQTVCGDIYIYV